MTIFKKMNKIQKVKFRDIDDFLSYLSAEELKVVELLRHIIFDCIPNCEEKLSYNVPFYYKHSRICFIWPASIPWGAVDKGVAIGFCKGNQLSDDINYLEKGERKEVYRKVFADTKDIDIDLLKSYIFEAVIIDGQKNTKKKNNSRPK